MANTTPFLVQHPVTKICSIAAEAEAQQAEDLHESFPESIRAILNLFELRLSMEPQSTGTRLHRYTKAGAGPLTFRYQHFEFIRYRINPPKSPSGPFLKLF